MYYSTQANKQRENNDQQRRHANLATHIDIDTTGRNVLRDAGCRLNFWGKCMSTVQTTNVNTQRILILDMDVPLETIVRFAQQQGVQLHMKKNVINLTKKICPASGGKS